jgi:subtilase family serine protease
MSANRFRRLRPNVDRLDDRCLLSGLSPAQMGHAYGFDSFHFVLNGQSIAANGAGQSIALIEAYHDPYIFNDLKTFDRNFRLPDPQATQYWFGSQTDDGWAGEEALDVEWAHALAPAAKIIIVEARSTSNSDMMAAVNFARYQAGVSVVSMSWGGGESPDQTSYDGYFTTPYGHKGITFIASSGDQGAWNGAEFPATSPNVLAVGGTTLYTDSRGTYYGESGWGNGNGASGGGYSSIESEPWYQYGVQSSGARTVPDVSMDADPNTGCMIFCTTPSTRRGSWSQIGGTSAAAPMWAALIAIADQGHALGGRGTLDGATQTLPAIYSSRMTGDFHDITQGFNGYSAGYGYDLVTGRGTPMAFNVVRDLMQVGYSAFKASAFGSFGNGGAGIVADSAATTAFSLTVATSSKIDSPTESVRTSSPFVVVPMSESPSAIAKPSASSAGAVSKHYGEIHDLALVAVVNDLTFDHVDLKTKWGAWKAGSSK